ncbi:MAG: EF-Tu/IF-2/RF-3 family GTPase [Candidatus Diapherotrites archaeon]
MGLFDSLLGKKSERDDAEAAERKLKIQALQSQGKSNLFTVDGAFFIKGVGVIPTGTVTSGVIMPGQKAEINGKVVQIKTIEANHRRLENAIEGEKIGMSLSNVSKEDIAIGDVLTFR